MLTKLKKAGLVLFLSSSIFLGACQSKEIFVLENDTIIGLTDYGLGLSLNKIEIPDTVSKVGTGAFSEVLNLNEITVPKEITFMEGALFGFSNLTLSLTNKNEKVVLEGGGTQHANVQIAISSISARGLSIELDNFNFSSYPLRSAISSSALGTINLVSKGVSNSITSLSGAECISLINGSLNISGTANLKVKGGNGGENLDGAFAIRAKSLTIQANAVLEATGGNGGNGAVGATGVTAGNGGDGHNGGKGAAAISVVSLNSNDGIIRAKSGNGGDGGNGGLGGQGVTGQEGVIGLSSNPWKDGQQGGIGGNGGNGGNGGGVSEPIIYESILGEANITQTPGLMGNGGNGGQGGKGGTGGSGATSGPIFIDTPYGLNGGNGGIGGIGGNGGDGRTGGLAGPGGLAGDGGRGSKKNYGIVQQLSKTGVNGYSGEPGEPGLPGKQVA